ncbi:MAG: FecR family protein [Chitinophagaceae bacterium]|nr:FecR family protein [Chitinophagaceae bacterium]
MKESRVFILLGKKLSNEATSEELAELNWLLKDKDVKSFDLELLQDIWQKNPGLDETFLDEQWEKVSGRLYGYAVQPSDPMPGGGDKRKVFSIRRLLAAASVVLLLIVTAWMIWLKPAEKIPRIVQEQIKDSVIVAQNGERKKVLLPDSTTVHLNSGSRLAYNKNFGKGNREVWLRGEAFFEVTKDAAHPFLVNTDRMLVKVLGTVFNVKSYDTKEDIETTVVEGKVEVSLKEGAEKKVILLPNEKISLKNSNQLKEPSFTQAAVSGISYEVKTVPVDIEKTGMPEEAVWIKEKVIFTDEPFEMVALKMERWYNVRIHFKNEKMKSILMNGDFDNVDIQHALQILQIMVNFKYEIIDEEIYIR